jgi:hypothetical protein
MASKKSVSRIGFRKIKKKEFRSKILPINRLHRPENALKFSVKIDASCLRYGTLKKKGRFHEMSSFFFIQYLGNKACVLVENVRTFYGS